MESGEDSDLEEGEIMSCDSADDIEELDAKRKLIQSYLDGSSVCVDDVEVDDQNFIVIDSDKEPKSTKTGKSEEKKTKTSSSKSPSSTTGKKKASLDPWEKYLEETRKAREDLNKIPKFSEEFGVQAVKATHSKGSRFIEEFGVPTISKDKERGKSKDHRGYNKDRGGNNSNRHYREHEKSRENRNRNKSSEGRHNEDWRSKDNRSRNKSAENKTRDNRSRNKSTEHTVPQGKSKDNRKNIESSKIKDTTSSIKMNECPVAHGNKNRKEIIDKLLGKNKVGKQSDLPGSKSKVDTNKTSPNLPVIGIASSLLAECKRTTGVELPTKPTSKILSSEKKVGIGKALAQKKDKIVINLNNSEKTKDKGVVDLTKNAGQKDNLDKMLENLDEMSSISDNDTSDQISKDSRVKRKRSSELTSPVDGKVESGEKPNKKTKTNENDETSESPLDESRPSPQTQEFQIIDDLNADEVNRISDEEEEMGEGGFSSDDLEDSEIYAWLDEGMRSRRRYGKRDPGEIVPIDEAEKSVLIEKGVDPFEVLPEGWVAVTHNSGMPTYLHKQTRVCTLSKPYFLGPGSVRKHDIPLSAIPCLQYKKTLAKEKKEEENMEAGNQPVLVNREKENQVAEKVESGNQPSLIVEGKENKDPETKNQPTLVSGEKENLDQGVMETDNQPILVNENQDRENMETGDQPILVNGEMENQNQENCETGNQPVLVNGVKESQDQQNEDQLVILDGGEENEDQEIVETGAQLVILDGGEENKDQEITETGEEPILVNGEITSPEKENGSSEADWTESSETKDISVDDIDVKDTSADDIDVKDISTDNTEVQDISTNDADDDTESPDVSSCIAGEDTEVKDTSPEETTDLDKTLTFDDKVEDTIDLDTTQTNDVNNIDTAETNEGDLIDTAEINEGNTMGTAETNDGDAINLDTAEVNEGDTLDTAENNEGDNQDTTQTNDGDNQDTTQTKDGEGDGNTEDGPKPGPPVKIETAHDRKIENSLSAEEVLEYCKRLFEFKSVTVKKFKTWKERRKHLNAVRKQSRPALPDHMKLITCSISADDGTDKPKKKEFVLNPLGKSPVCILHEYAQHTLKVQPRYAFQELENAQNPYCATVMINNVEYGKGYASSKKLAKMNAAKKTLGILIPEMKNIIEEEKEIKEDMSFFDEIRIEDPRVFDLCTKTGHPSPYQILLECLKRNYGMGDTHVKIDVKTLKHQKSEYTLSVGKHSVTIVCKNKREGKQRAAQAMLQQLHTHITSLGSLLRLYGQSSGKILKEKRKEEESITELQTHTHSNRPNIALLDKLRTEMTKLQSQRSSLTSKGSLLIDSVPGGVTSLDL